MLATLYSQSSSGGLYKNDNHSLELIAREGSHIHFTTQASTIVHSMPNGCARQAMHILAEQCAYAEYLPDPQILFPEASLHSSINITLADRATVVASDAFLTYDPVGGAGHPKSYTSEITIQDSIGRTLVIDRLRMTAEAFALRRPGVFGRFNAHATFLIVTRSAAIGDILNAGRSLGFSYEDSTIGVSTLPNSAGIICRILAADGICLKRAMHSIWCTVRRGLLGHSPSLRRK